MSDILPPFCHARARYRTLIASAFCMACVAAFDFPAVASQSPDVTRRLRAAKAGDRYQAAVDVANRKGTAALGDLTAAYSAESNPEIRLRLLIASYETTKLDSVPLLMQALKGDSSALVRDIAAQTLARAGESAGGAARRLFIDRLANDPDVYVRRDCAVALGFHHSADAVKALAQAASNRDPEMRHRAGLALTMHPKSAEVEKELDALERDPDSAVAARVKTRRRAAGRTLR